MFDTSVSIAPFYVYSLPIPPIFDDPRLNAAAQVVLSKVAIRGRERVAIGAQWGRATFSKITRNGAREWVWDAVRSGLLEKGVLVEHAHYVPGFKSKAYSLSPEYMYVPTRVIESPHITWKAPSAPASGHAATSPALPTKLAPAVNVHPWASESLQRVALDVPRLVRDMLLARGVPTKLADELSQGTGTASEATTEKRFATADFNTICDAIAAHAGPMADWEDSRDLTPVWQCWVDGNTWLYRDPAGQRLHTPITNMARKHRKYLYAVSEPAGTRYVEIDAVNSQVLFVAALVAKEMSAADIVAGDAADFAYTARMGLFYERSFTAVYGRTPTIAERDAWKATVMSTWLYATPQVQANSKEGAAIGALWPSVHTWLLARKRRDGVAAVPCEMQRLEASIWIDQLIPLLAAREIVAWTIHDCVIVPEHAEETVRELIWQAYEAAQVPAPILRTTYTD